MKVYYTKPLFLAKLEGIEFCCKAMLRAWHSVVFFNVSKAKLCFRERDKVHVLVFCPFCGKPAEHVHGVPEEVE